MGLAPYGKPKYAKLILDHLVDLKPDGSFRLDMSYFDYCTGLTMTHSGSQSCSARRCARPTNC
jgi:carbamoyltransferase